MRKLIVVCTIASLPFAAAAQEAETPEQYAARMGVQIANEEYSTQEYQKEVSEQGAGEYMNRRCNEMFTKNTALRQPCVSAAMDQDLKNFKAATAQQAPAKLPTYTFLDMVAAGDTVIGKRIGVSGKGGCRIHENICFISTEELLTDPNSSKENFVSLMFSVASVPAGSELRKQITACSELTNLICKIKVIGTVTKNTNNTYLMDATNLEITPPSSAANE
ncbi:hypothetical protein [Novacetimonas pomaceti]|nr:hypothetical protein [Novacetimonas pomaceti]